MTLFGGLFSIPIPIPIFEGAWLKSIVLIYPPVAKPGEPPAGIARLAGALRQNDIQCKVIDANIEHFVFEITGRVSKIEQFITLMRPLGLVEVCRTGVAALNLGPDGM